MKRPYEITVVVRILANEDETLNVLNQVTKWIEHTTDAGETLGKVTKLDRTSLGRRKLAYEIDKQRDGIYTIFYADIEPDHISELELNMRLSQSILRHLVVRLDETPAVAAPVAPVVTPAPVATAPATPATTTPETPAAE